MKIKYRIHTTTSNFPDAAFSSNVYLQIVGLIKSNRSSSPSGAAGKSSRSTKSKKSSKLVSVRFPLQISKNFAQKFRPGQTDLFEFDENTEIDKIKKIRLTHDSRNSRWHLKKLVIELVEFEDLSESPDRGGKKKEKEKEKENVIQKWTFDCNKWVDGSDAGVEFSPMKNEKTNEEEEEKWEETDEYDEFDSDSSYFSDDERRARKKEKKKREKEKEKEKERKQNDLKKIRYKIKIVTNEISKIEPGTKIKIKIVGANGETDWIRVDEFHPIHIFKAEENDVGMIVRLVISSKNKENGKPIDWYFDQIVVSVHKFKTFIFNSKGRSIISLDKEKNRLLNEIFPSEIQDISKKLNYTVSFYSRTHPLASNELSVKLYGEFGNSGEFKTKLFKSELKSKKLFAKNILVNFSQKFFDFGKVYKIDLGLIESRNVKADLESLKRSFISLTHGKQQYNLYYIKNKSIKKEKERNDDDEFGNNNSNKNVVKIVFYEQEYMKKQFGDELVHDMMFDEQKRHKPREQDKHGSKHRHRSDGGSSRSTNRSSESVRRNKYDDNNYSNFESDHGSPPRGRSRSIEKSSPKRERRDRTVSIERYSPPPRRQNDRTGSRDSYRGNHRRDSFDIEPSPRMKPKVQDERKPPLKKSYEFDEPDYYKRNYKSNYNNKEYNKRYDERDYFGVRKDEFGYRNKEKDMYDTRNTKTIYEPRTLVRRSASINLDDYDNYDNF